MPTRPSRRRTRGQETKEAESRDVDNSSEEVGELGEVTAAKPRDGGQSSTRKLKYPLKITALERRGLLQVAVWDYLQQTEGLREALDGLIPYVSTEALQCMSCGKMKIDQSRGSQAATAPRRATDLAAPRDFTGCLVGEALSTDLPSSWPWRYRRMFGDVVGVCPECDDHIGSGSFCPLCGSAYEVDEVNMVQCDICNVSSRLYSLLLSFSRSCLPLLSHSLFLPRFLFSSFLLSFSLLALSALNLCGRFGLPFLPSHLWMPFYLMAKEL